MMSYVEDKYSLKLGSRAVPHPSATSKSLGRTCFLGYISSKQHNATMTCIYQHCKDGNYYYTCDKEESDDLHSSQEFPLDEESCLGYIETNPTVDAYIPLYHHAKDPTHHFWTCDEDESFKVHDVGRYHFIQVLGYMASEPSVKFDIPVSRHHQAYESEEARRIRALEEMVRGRNRKFQMELEVQRQRDQSYRLKHIS